MPITKFQSKLETDLLELVKRGTTARTMAISPNGKIFALYCSDRYIRVFRFLTGRLMHTYDETYALYDRVQDSTVAWPSSTTSTVPT